MDVLYHKIKDFKMLPVIFFCAVVIPVALAEHDEHDLIKAMVQEANASSEVVQEKPIENDTLSDIKALVNSSLKKASVTSPPEGISLSHLHVNLEVSVDDIIQSIQDLQEVQNLVRMGNLLNTEKIFQAITTTLDTMRGYEKTLVDPATPQTLKNEALVEATVTYMGLEKMLSEEKNVVTSN